MTGEEKGLPGRDFHVHLPEVSPDSVVADITFDMLLMLRPLRDVIAFGAEHSSHSSRFQGKIRTS